MLLGASAVHTAGAACVCSKHDAEHGIRTLLVTANAACEAGAVCVCSEHDAKRGISTMLIAASATVVVNTAFTSPDLAKPGSVAPPAEISTWCPPGPSNLG